MINLLNVVTILKLIVEERFPEVSAEVSDLERVVAENLLPVLVASCKNCQISEHESLVQVNDNQYAGEEDDIDRHAICLSQNSVASYSSQCSNYSNETVTIDDEIFSLDYCQSVISFVDSHPNARFGTITHHFRRIKDFSYIKRFREYIAKSGSKIDKLLRLKEKVFEYFQTARNMHLPVHDINLKRWALQIANEISLEDFCASPFWLVHFKREYKITSRKITKFVSRIEENINIYEISSTFLNTIKPILLQYNPANIINTDQSGFNYELHSNRTLSNKGERITALHVLSTNAISHSYSIQPIISMNGRLLPKFLLCLQEQSGKFGPIVLSKFPNYSNVIVKCTTSGKMTKELIYEFNSSFVKEYINGNFLYIADSWSGQTDSNMYYEIFGNNCNFLQIPPHCTSILQPLDVYFFRFWKLFAKRISNEVILYNWPVSLKDRNNIITMHALIHNQLSAPAFYPLIKYAFFKSGFLIDRVQFSSVIDICFSNDFAICSDLQCSQQSFIQCSWCFKALCFDHFFIQIHYHENE